MKYVIAFLILCAARAASAQDIRWHENLDNACAEAAADKKLVLLRQVVCDCESASCAYAALARAPWFLRDDQKREERKELVKQFVFAVVHVKRGEAQLMIADPGFLPTQSPLRTIFLTCAKAVIHRLDLCTSSSNIAFEVDFVRTTAAACFGEDGRPKFRDQRNLRQAHEDHRLSHGGSGVASPECGCAPPDAANARSAKRWINYQKGIFWHTDLVEARSLAAASSRLILYYQIAGDMNKNGC